MEINIAVSTSGDNWVAYWKEKNSHQHNYLKDKWDGGHESAKIHALVAALKKIDNARIINIYSNDEWLIYGGSGGWGRKREIWQEYYDWEDWERSEEEEGRRIRPSYLWHWVGKKDYSAEGYGLVNIAYHFAKDPSKKKKV